MGFFEDGNIGVSIFPESEEIAVGSEGICDVALHRVGARKAQMCQCTERIPSSDPSVIRDFLKFFDGFGALAGSQVCLAAHIYRIERTEIGLW